MKKTLKKLFEKIKNLILVSRDVEDNEIISRVLICPKHISLNSTEFDHRKFSYFFLQYGGGVSVNRSRYVSESKLKKNSKKIFSKEQKYIGFAVFNIDIFKDSYLEYIEKYKDSTLATKIEGTPMNKNGEYIKSNYVFTFQRGNVAHADIYYEEFSNRLEEPNTSCRNFSKILAQKSIKLIDQNVHDEKWLQNSFKKEILINKLA